MILIVTKRKYNNLKAQLLAAQAREKALSGQLEMMRQLVAGSPSESPEQTS
ncbi:MAG TPA: hypothetical protein VNH41_00995 [Steroidobacteraceae bacterium]|nr:hypothetical protein [Steroidobacteraceae bacterium]